MKQRRRLPHAALLVLAVPLASVVIWLTWPNRATVLCEQLPQLVALAACAAALFVVSVRALAGARAASPSGQIVLIPAGAAILAALAFFLSVRFVAVYRVPCAAVQQQFKQSLPAAH